MLTVGSLFSGIGGFDLGFERAGMRTVWFCEQDAFCQRVLAKHWPGVPCYPDVKRLVADPAGRTGQLQSSEGRAEGLVSVPVPYVDVLCGGFPCQDISLAGKGAGIDGARSGLWREFARLIGELRPRYVVVENVPAITSRGLDRVLADLAACGFDAEWDHLPASAFGAPHRRDRFWLVAYPDASGRGARFVDIQARKPDARGRGADGSDADGGRLQECAERNATRPRQQAPLGHDADGLRIEVADAERTGLEGHGAVTGGAQEPEPWDGGALADAARGVEDPASGGSGARGAQRTSEAGADDGLGGTGGWWESEPDVGRVADGVPARVDRLRSLGNALVPQIAEWIGGRIVSWEAARSEKEKPGE